MKTLTHCQHGLSLVELAVVLATVALVIGFILPVIYRPRSGCTLRIRCVNNLKQIGLSVRLWSNDNGDQFPFVVSSTSGGTLEFGNTPQVFRHFQAMSNELNTPKILVCNSDEGRLKAADFTSFGNSNVSYFVNLDAVETNPQMILSGDRNITGGILVNSNLLFVRSNSPLSWTKSMHVSAGNVVLADGSVQQVTSSVLNQQIAALTNAAIHLAIP